MAAPIVGVAPLYAIVFLGYSVGQKIQRKNDTEELNLTQIGIAGCISGVCGMERKDMMYLFIYVCMHMYVCVRVCVCALPILTHMFACVGIFTTAIMVPGERIKCTLQIQGASDGPPKYKGPMDVIKSVRSLVGVVCVWCVCGVCAVMCLMTVLRSTKASPLCSLCVWCAPPFPVCLSCL